MSKSKPSVIFLMGPTASGKTDLAIALSAHMPIDLISVDSALVYREMDVGSAKPDKDTLERYPHQLIDIRDPSEPYSAADFCRDAEACIAKSHAVDRIPLLVGGTMLYFKALRDGLADMPPTSPEIRKELESRAEKEGWPALHKELGRVDPVTASRLHPNHSARIERALQVYISTGIPLSEYHVEQEKSDFSERFDLRQLAILPRDRELLHDRISFRLDRMFQEGFVEEVEALFQRSDLSPELPAIRAVGYRQLWSYFENEIDLDEARKKALFATRKLAKRQLTWMRSWSHLKFIYTQDERGVTLSSTQMENACLKFLNMD